MVNGTCIINTHSSRLPLSILLLSTATQLWDGMGHDKLKTIFLPCTRYQTLAHTHRKKIMVVRFSLSMHVSLT